MQTAATDPTRTEIETVDCEQRARAALMAATKRVGGPWESIASRLASALRDLCALRSRGLNPVEFGEIEACVSGVVADLFPVVTDINHIRRMRSMADREDDRLTDLHAIDGPHVVSHRELAASYRKAAAANLAAARVHEKLDREQHRNAGVAIARLRQGRAS